MFVSLSSYKHVECISLPQKTFARPNSLTFLKAALSTYIHVYMFATFFFLVCCRCIVVFLCVLLPPVDE